MESDGGRIDRIVKRGEEERRESRRRKEMKSGERRRWRKGV